MKVGCQWQRYAEETRSVQSKGSRALRLIGVRKFPQANKNSETICKKTVNFLAPSVLGALTP